MDTTSPLRPPILFRRIPLIALAAATLLAATGLPAQAPAFPAEVLGQRSVTYTYTGVRPVPPVPAPGVHPRVFFGPEELPALRDRLAGTAVGQEAFRMIQLYTSLLRNGRAVAWNPLPASFRTMPDGTPRIGNVGLYDRSVVYNELVAGNTSTLDTMIAAKDGTGLYALGGLISLEAFECLVLEGQTGIAERSSRLAAALTTWAGRALAEPCYPGNPGALGTARYANHFVFGGHHTAVAYDLAHRFLSEPQRETVRRAAARMMRAYFTSEASATDYTGVGVAPEAVATNWVAINSFKLLAACALDGDPGLEQEGFTASELSSWIDRAAGSYHKFLTYGFHASGAPLEGLGKNYLYGANLIPLARRGHDFFGHPFLRAYKDRFIPAIIQPFGYSLLEYDLLGGSGTDPERGRQFIESLDAIALKWRFPGDPAADFLWRNFVQTEYRLPGGGRGLFLDLRDTKFTLRSVYLNQLLPAAIFASDIESTLPWADHNAQAQGTLDYLDREGGSLIARSGFGSDAATLVFHVRQNMGGHTFADRNTFTLSALGRLFVNYNSGSSNSGLQEPRFHSIVQVDGLSMKVTPKEGAKHRIPAKLAAWSALGGDAVFATGDATYNYSNEWWWNAYSTGSVPLNSGFSQENNSHNTFRRAGNKIPEAFGDTPFRSFPHWLTPGQFEGIQAKPYNPMRQVLRTIGLVRGPRPYVLVVDDVRKDDTARTYEWLASLPADLSPLIGAEFPALADPATDVMLAEPAATGNRRLLVRVLRALGTAASVPDGASGTPLGFVETIASPNTTETWRRLVIRRTEVVAPEFRILLFPFRDGESLPVTTFDGTELSVALDGRTDVFAFAPRTIPVDGQNMVASEFRYLRNGTQQIDYRGLIEPVPARGPAGVATQAAAWNIPGPWIGQQIGSANGQLASQANYLANNGGTFAVTAGGGDIWSGTNEAFAFIHQPWTGDGVFTARVAAFSSSDSAAKAGIMIRESAAVGARNSFVYITRAGNGFTQHKTSAAANVSTTQTGGSAAPRWVRLVRIGNALSGFLSANGTTWSQLGTTSLNPFANSTVLVGVAACPRTSGTAATVRFDNVSLHSLLQSWRYQRFGTPVGEDVAADDEDPDGDGTPNLVEYAVGTDPLAPTGGPIVSFAEGTLTMTFNRVSDSLIRYSVLAASNLEDGWTEIWSSTGAANTPGAVTLTDTAPPAPGRFLRLAVSVPQ